MLCPNIDCKSIKENPKIIMKRTDKKSYKISVFKCKKCSVEITIPWGCANLIEEDEVTNYKYEEGVIDNVN